MADSERFRDAREKIHRADTHISDFVAADKAFRKPRPYALFQEQDPYSLVWWLRHRITRNVGPELRNLTIIAGDAIHNLRSALDYVIHALLAERRRHRPTNSVEMARLVALEALVKRREKVIGFPAHDQAKDLAAIVTKKAEVAGQDAVDLINRIEPCQGGKGHAIWQLDSLNNIDKHRLLLTVGIGIDAFTTTYRTPTSFVEAVSRFGAKKDMLDLLRGMGMSFHHEIPTVPLEDGAKLMWSNTPFSKMDMEVEFTPTIAFNEPKVMQPESVIETLESFRNLVSDLLDDFERLPIPPL